MKHHLKKKNSIIKHLPYVAFGFCITCIRPSAATMWLCVRVVGGG